jgi:hypothetical protein
VNNFIDYNLVAYAHPSELEKFVKAHMMNGWSLFGTPFQVLGGVCQALMKQSESEEALDAD